MEKEFRREQHYAVSKAGILTNIKVAHSNSEDYYCPHCGCRMIKKCGKKRTWHFAHDWHDDNELQKNCSYESYLHAYAKLRLKQWFDESNSIKVYYVQSIVCKCYYTCNLNGKERCKQQGCEKSFDLKKCFQNCSIESTINTSNGNYRADLLLSPYSEERKRLLFEIKVSHECTEKKKISGVPIIEFDVNSEEDVDYIISHDIRKSDKVKFYGFNLEGIDDKGQIHPLYDLQKFILYKSGKTFCKDVNCQIINGHYDTTLFEFTTRICQEYGLTLFNLNLYGLMKARERGFIINNCFLCKHNCYNEDSECRKCEINGKRIEKGTDALGCNSYVFKQNVFEKIKYLSFEPLYVWSLS